MKVLRRASKAQQTRGKVFTSDAPPPTNPGPRGKETGRPVTAEKPEPVNERPEKKGSVVEDVAEAYEELAPMLTVNPVGTKSKCTHCEAATVIVVGEDGDNIWVHKSSGVFACKRITAKGNVADPGENAVEVPEQDEPAPTTADDAAQQPDDDAPLSDPSLAVGPPMDDPEPSDASEAKWNPGYEGDPHAPGAVAEEIDVEGIRADIEDEDPMRWDNVYNPDSPIELGDYVRDFVTGYHGWAIGMVIRLGEQPAFIVATHGHGQEMNVPSARLVQADPDTGSSRHDG